MMRMNLLGSTKRWTLSNACIASFLGDGDYGMTVRNASEDRQTQPQSGSNLRRQITVKGPRQYT